LLASVLGAWRAFKTGTWLSAIGLALPGLAVLGISIFADKGENMRFKFFLEPVMIVFLAAQASFLAQDIRGLIRRMPHQASTRGQQ
jgi:hypothetical protein